MGVVSHGSSVIRFPFRQVARKVVLALTDPTDLRFQCINGFKRLLIAQLSLKRDLDQAAIQVARVVEYMNLQQRLLAIHGGRTPILAIPWCSVSPMPSTVTQ